MSYDLCMLSFTYEKTGSPRGDEGRIMRKALAPYCRGGMLPPEEVTSGVGLQAHSSVDEWGGAWITGISNTSLGVNRPPLHDPEFVTIIYDIACRADCYFIEPTDDIFVTVSDEQYAYWQERQEKVVLVRSTEEFFQFWHSPKKKPSSQATPNYQDWQSELVPGLVKLAGVMVGSTIARSLRR